MIKNFHLLFCKTEENELAEIIKPIGFQNQQANHFKKPLLKLLMSLGERFPV